LKKNLVIAIYSRPEYYPPTLNAIEFLSEKFDNIYVAHRNYIAFPWDYPENVFLSSNGALRTIKEVENSSGLKKIILFLRFTALLFSLVRKHKADTVLIYDSLPVLSFFLIRPFTRKPRILWYHNHDVSEKQYMRKWSISWWAWKSEKWLFPSVNIFSLPSLDRKKYFPMEKLGGNFFFLPNFPSMRLVKRFVRSRGKIELSKQIRLIFQGSIGPEHGFEEIIEILKNKIQDRELHLTLRGFIDPSYKRQLEDIAKHNGVSEHLAILPFAAYQDILTDAVNYHIGIGIYMKKDIMNSTIGTASNKIFEYASAGMPVLVYDNEYFRGYFGHREWVLFTDTSKKSLIDSIDKSFANFQTLSEKAFDDFSKDLCFEKNFDRILTFI
jgi:hypothetical protein